MRLLLTIAILASLALADPPVKKKAPPQKALVSHRSTSKSKSRAAIPRRPSTQMSPSSDRYKEIQQALVAKGYLQTPATGVWNQDSQEAMRRFQADSNLDATGKLNSRSLISLGLGPKQ
jgi:peptidoglycan hydrolase-like protein with peptidoglycan-binding domain